MVVYFEEFDSEKESRFLSILGYFEEFETLKHLRFRSIFGYCAELNLRPNRCIDFSLCLPTLTNSKPHIGLKVFPRF